MYIVFDIGGTNMRVARASKEALGDIKKVPTPKEPEPAIAQLGEIAKELAGGSVIEAAAGCVAGSITADGVISDARNLSAWQGTNVKERFSEILGCPVSVANDAGVVGLGEAVVGAGKGAERLVYVTVSTGVGGAYIIGGEIQAAGGVGHTMIGDADLESQVSGTAVKKKFGIEPKELDSLDERNKLADILAEGLVKVLETWPADTIVLGGSMIVGVNPIPLESVQVRLAQLVEAPPAIKMAALGDTGGLEGGRILASRL
jgi:glucokinase